MPSDESDSQRSKPCWGVWYNYDADVLTSASIALEAQGYKLLKKNHPFGTMLLYRKGDDFKVVFPCEPDKVMSVRESREYIAEHWKFRHKQDESYYIERILKPLGRA